MTAWVHIKVIMWCISITHTHRVPTLLQPRFMFCLPLQKSTGSTSDPRLLHSLARKPSIRHGPSKTVSGQFHMSLVSLMERLEKTNPFFVRCIKSNNNKVCPSYSLHWAFKFFRVRKGRGIAWQVTVVHCKWIISHPCICSHRHLVSLTMSWCWGSCDTLEWWRRSR